MLFLPAVAFAAGQRVVFVKASAPVGGSGLSWATAFQSLQQGLAAASALEKPVQVWVASGVYTPFDGSTNRALSFKLENGVEIYGGFNGTETTLSQRFPGEYSTILSGDRLGNDSLGTFGNYTENAYHVVTGVGVDSSAILDGVYIYSGNANGSGAQASGGGIYLKSGASPTLRGCRFNYNFAISSGAGMYLDSSSPLIENLQLNGNRALLDGAGLCLVNGSDVSILGGSAYLNAAGFDGPGSGGAISVASGSSLKLNNVYFYQNTARNGGGAIAESGAAELTVVSCSFDSNSVPTQAASPTYFGGAIWAAGPSTPVKISQSLFTSNTVAAGYGGAISVGNLPLDVVCCRLYNNSASAFGAGIFLNGGTARVTNAIIAGNRGTSLAAASGNGNAITSIGQVILRNCTITGNTQPTSSGYAVYAAFGSLDVANCIIYGDSGLGEIFTGNGVTKTVQYSCVQGTLQPGTGNINANPLFRVGIGPDNQWGTFDDNLRLAYATSPCIDAGSNALVPADVADLDGDGNVSETLPFDVDGGVRIVRDRVATASAIVNLGAYEGGLDQSIWKNGNGGSWSSSANWFNDLVPTQAVNAIFNNSSTPTTNAYTVQMLAGTRAPEAYQLLFSANKAVTFNFSASNLTLAGGIPGDESLQIGGVGNVMPQLRLQTTGSLARRSLIAPSVAVGSGGGQSARLIVSGDLAGLDLSDRLVVGRDGLGFLDLELGTTANVANFISGLSEGSIGATTVTGGSGLNMTSDGASRVILGSAGSSSISIASSKFAATGPLLAVDLGLLPQSSGSMSLDNSSWKTAQSTFTVGSQGSGNITLTNGSKLTTSTSTSPAIGKFPGSSGNVLITSGSSWTEAVSGVAIGGADGADGGVATVDVRAGATLKAAGPIVLYRNGVARGLGQFIAPVNNWGAFSPGILDGANFGVLNVTGTYTQSNFSFFNIGSDSSPFGPRSSGNKSGVYLCDVQGTTPGETHDQIAVVGTAALGGGLVVNDRGYTPPQSNGHTGVRILTANFLDRKFDVALMPPILGKRYLTLGYGLNFSGASVELLTDSLDSEIQFIPGAERSAAGYASAVATGDVNGDGLPDLVAAYPSTIATNPGTVVVYINNGTTFGGWAGYRVLPAITVGVNPRGITTAKLRAGANRDIIVTSAGGDTVDVLQNNGGASPTFTRSIIATLPAGSKPWGVAVYGRSSISGLDTNFAVANSGSNSVAAFQNSGIIANIIKISELPSGPNPVDVEPFDPDGGKDDDQQSVAVSSGGGSDVTAFVNSGTGTLGAGTSFAVGGKPGKITHGDFDGDQTDDIAVVSPGSGLLSILLGDGLGGFKPSVDLPIGNNPLDVKAMDADNDGDIDLVLVYDNGSTRTTQIFRNDLTYSLSGVAEQFTLCPEDVLTAASTAGLIAVADLDGNGYSDVVTLDASAAKPRIASAINKSTPCRADFNADGFLDFSDFDDFVVAFESGSVNTDFNGDGFLDFSDFDDFVAAFEAGCG